MTITTAQPSPDRPPGTQRATPPTVTSAPSATVPVPASFRLLSVSTAADRTLFALGTVTCPGGALCPALAASGDDGITWRQVHVFTGAGVLPPGQAGRPGGTGVLSQVRFANTSVGWVYGGDILRTSDGGATWEDYPHAGGDVVDLATDGTDVVLTTADRCSGGTCSGTLRVLRAPIAATSATDVAGTLGSRPDDHGRAGLLAPGTGLCLPGDHSSCRGSPPRAQSSSVPMGFTLQVQPAVGGVRGRRSSWRLRPGRPCSRCVPPVGPQDIWVCGARQHRCRRDVAARPLRRSGTGERRNHGVGRRRREDAAGRVRRRSRPPRLHGAQRHRRRTLAGSQNSATAAQPRWAWVGAPGGSTFYAVAADPSSGYWKSTDRGETWAPVTVAGR